MQDIDVALAPKVFFKGLPPLRLSETFGATGCSFCRVPAGMGVVDWHNPRVRELVIWLTGEVEFETSDGDIRRLSAGSIVVAEDTTGKVMSHGTPQRANSSSMLTFVGSYGRANVSCGPDLQVATHCRGGWSRSPGEEFLR